MGKKRLTDMGAEPPKKGKKDEKDRQLVKSGKQQGRVTDMSALAMIESEQQKKKEKELEKLTAKKAEEAEKEETKKTTKLKKKRSQKYLQAKKQVDRTKLYSLSKAIKLVKKTSLSTFNGRIELHLTVREKGLKREVKLPYPIGKEKKLTFKTEKKSPLIHLVIGDIKTEDKKIAQNFEMIIEAVGPKNIKKAVLVATMGPGIKVDINPETPSKK